MEVWRFTWIQSPNAAHCHYFDWRLGEIHETQPSKRPPNIANACVWSVAARLDSHVQCTYTIASDLRPEQLMARVYTRCSTKRFAHVCSHYRRGEHFNVASIAEQGTRSVLCPERVLTGAV